MACPFVQFPLLCLLPADHPNSIKFVLDLVGYSLDPLMPWFQLLFLLELRFNIFTTLAAGVVLAVRVPLRKLPAVLKHRSKHAALCFPQLGCALCRCHPTARPIQHGWCDDRIESSYSGLKSVGLIAQHLLVVMEFGPSCPNSIVYLGFMRLAEAHTSAQVFRRSFECHNLYFHFANRCNPECFISVSALHVAQYLCLWV